MLKDEDRREDDEPRSSTAHDLRHSLFALRTGIELLTQVRGDPDRFAEVQRLLRKEVHIASGLLNELLEGRG